MRTIPVHIIFIITLLSCSSEAKKVGVFYDKNIPQFEFAATDIEEALKLRGYEVEMMSLDELSKGYDKMKIVLALKSQVFVSDLLVKEGGEQDNVGRN